MADALRLVSCLLFLVDGEANFGGQAPRFRLELRWLVASGGRRRGRDLDRDPAGLFAIQFLATRIWEHERASSPGDDTQGVFASASRGWRFCGGRRRWRRFSRSWCFAACLQSWLVAFVRATNTSLDRHPPRLADPAPRIDVSRLPITVALRRFCQASRPRMSPSQSRTWSEAAAAKCRAGRRSS